MRGKPYLENRCDRDEETGGKKGQSPYKRMDGMSEVKVTVGVGEFRINVSISFVS